MTAREVEYHSDDQHRFVVENYNWARSFSNFFPGIAGEWGIPIWCYYVSRNQGICSMGVEDKHHQILEFLSFNKAIAQVGRIGYRTFFRLEGGEIYEPFRKVDDEAIHQRMAVSSSELEITDTNERIGLRTHVTYFPLVSYPIPALVRCVEVTNLADRRLRVEIVDGLPHLFPYGLDTEIIHVIPRHIEGMMTVADRRGVPLFRLKQTPGDTERVSRLKGGNFYLSYVGGEPGGIDDNVIVDPAVIFSEAESYDYPWGFHDAGAAGLRERLGTQIRCNRTPCAFRLVEVELEPDARTDVRSLVGYVREDAELDRLIDDAASPELVDRKRRESFELVQRIKHRCLTVTGSSAFDEYCHQTFLDNVVRGGMPRVFETADGSSAFYLYSRQNGDLERDYHHFVVEASYMSQGTGHYRSVLQNRRCDSWFFPEVGDYNVRLFTSLTQLDSYSPLEVLGTTYSARDLTAVGPWLEELAGKGAAYDRLLEMVRGRFTPGRFIMALEDLGVRTDRAYDTLLEELLAHCVENEIGGRLHLGFWIDHWSYNLDTIDLFLMVFPDRLRELLLETRSYTFYDNPDRVRPRCEKQVFDRGRVRQYDAVVCDEEKSQLIDARAEQENRVRTQRGAGEVYRTNLLGKLLCLVVNRMATLDPDNAGVEMEANKPGWNDSMSAVAGIFGASVCQTFEVEKACRFLRDSLDRLGLAADFTQPIFEELAAFMQALSQALAQRLVSNAADRRFRFWDESHTIKEEYRARVRLGISGVQQYVSVAEMREFLDRALALLGELRSDEEDARAFHPSGIPYTYLSYEVPEFEPLSESRAGGAPARSHQGYPLVEPRTFRPRPIALFLEGPARYLKAHPEAVDQVWRSVRESGLYDRKLKMYKVCESLRDETFEIGRVHAWGAGWIENESVYTHMEYKYLLELLRAGACEQFYEDVESCFTCFSDPAVYGRSPVENVSFVVSSAFVDESMHGQGLQPRLSGVTNEMLHIWTLMMAGAAPFFLEDGALGLRLAPRLPAWLFTEQSRTIEYFGPSGDPEEVTIPEHCVAFVFLGRCLVVYHNPERKPTYGDDGARVRSYRVTDASGQETAVVGEVLDTPLAHAVRSGRVTRLDVELA